MNTEKLKEILKVRRNQVIAGISAVVMVGAIAIGTMSMTGPDLEGAVREYIKADIIKDIKRSEALMGMVDRNAKKTSDAELAKITDQVNGFDLNISSNEKQADGSYVALISLKGTLENPNNGEKNDLNMNISIQYVIIEDQVKVQKFTMLK